MRLMSSREKNRQKAKPQAIRNRYFRDSKLSESRFLRILKAFADDFSASDAARASGVSLRSVNDIYVRLRDRIWQDIWSDPDLFNGMGRYLRICAEVHIGREGRKLEYEGSPFKVMATDGPYRRAAASDALEIKEELLNANVVSLWKERRRSRRMTGTQLNWAHIVEIYARERSGTLRRPRDHSYIDKFAKEFLQAKERGSNAECRRLLEEYETNMKRFGYRGEGNKRFFDDMKRMLKRNPL